jgi:hypothetical protein
MDIKTWSKDQTKNRGDEVVDFPANPGWQPPAPNRFQRAAKLFFQILLAWIGLEVIGLRYVVGMNRNAFLVGSGITLLIVCLQYFHTPIRVGIGVLFHRIVPDADASITASLSTLDLEEQPELDDEAYSQAYVGDDGELIFNAESVAKPQRDEL